MGMKWTGCEVDHPPQSSAEVKNAWSYTSTPAMRLHGVVLCQEYSTGTTLPLPLTRSFGIKTHHKKRFRNGLISYSISKFRLLMIAAKRDKTEHGRQICHIPTSFYNVKPHKVHRDGG
jgi:hypothetical protein